MDRPSRDGWAPLPDNACPIPSGRCRPESGSFPRAQCARVLWRRRHRSRTQPYSCLQFPGKWNAWQVPTDRLTPVRWVDSFPLFSSAAGASLDHLKRLLDAQRSADLAWRILLERLEETANESYGRHHRPELFAPPTAIQHSLGLVAFPRILPQIGDQRNVGGFLRAGEQVALDGLETQFPVGVSHSRQVAIVREVEEFLSRPFGDLALQERQEVVTIEMCFEGLVSDLHAVQEFSLHIGFTGCGQEGRQKVFARDDVVDDGARLDRAGPFRHHWNAESALVGRALFAAERGVTTVRPGKGLGAVIAGEDHNGIVGNAGVIQLPHD